MARPSRLRIQINPTAVAGWEVSDVDTDESISDGQTGVVVTMTGTVADVVRNRHAIGYQANSVYGFVNGTQISTEDTVADMPTVTHLSIDTINFTGSQYNKHIKEIQYYNVQKSEAFVDGLSDGTQEPEV